MVEGVTPEELQIIQREHINVTAISDKSVMLGLQRAGFSQERAAQIRAANQPQFRVYGARSPGAIPQAARLEAAKELGLPSTTKAAQIAAVAKQRGVDVSASGYEYTIVEGKRYVGTKKFLESKRQEDIQIHAKEKQLKEQEQFEAISIIPYGPENLSLQQRYAELGQPQQETVELGTIQKVLGVYNRAESFVAARTTKPVFQLLRDMGIDPSSVAIQTKYASIPLKMLTYGAYGTYTPKSQKVEQFYGGFMAGIAKDIEEKPIKQVALVGAGAAAGFVFRGAPLVTKVGTRALLGPTAGAVAGGVVKVGLTGGGLYLTGAYIYGKGKEIYNAPSAAEAGSITGVALKDVTLVGTGTRYGTKLAEQTYGYIRTYNMQDVTKLTVDPRVESGKAAFVELKGAMKMSQAQRGKVYKGIFESQTLNQALGVKQGGIHAAPESTSTFETLRGALHIAPRASSHFTGIEASSYQANVPTLKTLFASLYTVNEPSLFYFEAPSGFKYVPGKEVTRTPYSVYSFRGRLPSGTTAIIPAGKPEIEAVFVPAKTSGFSLVPFTPSYAKTLGTRIPFVATLTPTATGATGSLTATETLAMISSYGSGTRSIPGSVLGYALPSVSKISIRSVPTSRYSSALSSYTISSIIPSPSPYPRPSRRGGGSYRPSQSPSPSPSPYPSPSPSPSRGRGSSYVPPRYDLYEPPSSSVPMKGAVIFKTPKSEGYAVFGRRFGVFKPLATGKTIGQAFRIGKKFAGTTLGATFKIPGARARKLKGFTTKYTKHGILYIEPRGRRLKRGTGEIPEIQLFKKMKMRRR